MAPKSSEAGGQRGQIVSYDIYLAVFVFLLLFGAMYLLWQGNLRQLDRERKLMEMKYTAIQVMDYLVSSQGSPVDWEVDLNPTALGLASERLLISADKAARMPGLAEGGIDKLSYENAKTLLGLASYEYYLKIEGASGVLFETGKAGDSQAYVVSEYPLKDVRVGYSRAVKYANKRALMTLILYG